MALAKKYRLNLRLNRYRVEQDCQKKYTSLFIYLIGSSNKRHSHSRFAILLSKKLAKKAVNRNKIKRKISQAIYNSLSVLDKNKDIILIPKKEILSKTINQIAQDLKNVLSV